MSETPSNEGESVLRPFEAPEHEPLPPVEPSKVVPAPPPVAKEPEPVEPEPVEPEPVEAVFEAEPVELEPSLEVDPAFDDEWAPAPESSRDDFAADGDEPVEESSPVEKLAPDSADDDVAAELLDADILAVDDEEPEAFEPAAPASDFEPDNAVATVAPTTGDDTVTLPRTPFLVGLGVLFAAIAGLALLWQSAGGDDATEATPAPSSVPRVVDGDTDDSVLPPPIDTSAFDAQIAGLTSDLATSQAEASSLQAEVDLLQDRPAPGLPGSQMRRIVVGADAKFVSSQPDSVAVIGAFGGLSLIDPATNRVVANGNVANGADRVMRTPTSVWLTNYTDNQILRIDPITTTVAATFPFEGPDGIEKDGDTIVVASFDGGFVARVHPASGETLQSVSVGGEPTAVLSHPDHGLWAAVFNTGELVQIDRDSFEILQRVTVGAGPVGIGFDATHLWVANHDEGTIAKVDPTTGEVDLTVVVGEGPTELVAVEGSVWVTLTQEGSLVQVDANSGEIITRTPLGGTSASGGPTGIAHGNGAIWVAMSGEQSVVRVDL